MDRLGFLSKFCSFFLGFRELKQIEKHGNRVPMFMNLEFRDFDLSLSHFLTPLFRSFLTVSDESE